MKILQVINFFSPLHGGGSIEVAYQLSKHLAQRGHEVVIYTSDYELDQDYINSLSNIEICPFRACSLFGQWPLTPSLFRKVKNHLREFDIVHMHNYPTFQNVAVHHYANKHRIPYVLGAYGSMVQYSNRWLKEAFGLLFGHRIIRDASKLLAMTPFEANQYQDQGIDSDRIVEVPNCIDISKFDHLPEKGTFRNEFNINEDHIVLFLGRIHKIKGLDILVQAVAKLVQEGKNLRLVVIGPDDGYLSTIQKLVQETGIAEKTLFTGFVSGETRLAAYVDTDVYVLPSVYETFPTTVLESCACGTPVIVTDQCQIAHLVKDNMGFVIPHNADELHEAINIMLTDEETKTKLGQQGQSLVRERFSWSQCARQVEAIYTEVVAKKHEYSK